MFSPTDTASLHIQVDQELGQFLEQRQGFKHYTERFQISAVHHNVIVIALCDIVTMQVRNYQKVPGSEVS